MKKSLWLTLLIFLALASPIYAQGGHDPPQSTLQFTHLSRADGLPDDSAYAVFQDSQGFIWIGTRDGLARYDGYNFQIYRPEPGNPSSLSDRDIRAFVEDGQGNLWIGIERGGLNKFNSITGVFTSYQEEKET